VNVETLREGLAARDLLELVADVARQHGATVDEVLAQDKTPRVSHARQAVWHALRHHPERRYSYPDIGRLFGRDHSTIIYGVRAYERWLLSRSAP